MRRLLPCVALLSTLLLATTACGKPAAPGGSSGTGVLGEGLSSTASASPSASPSATPSPTTGPTAPPATGVPGPITHAAIANKSGYVWVSAPAAASTVATGSYAYNSTGGAITTVRNSVGNYTITFAGLGTAGGVAHANAYGSTANFCNVVSWSSSGADEKVTVVCYTSGTALVDSTFVANFAVGHQAGAHFSYLWNDQASATGQHVPAVSYRYDSTGRDPWIERIATGRYKVYLPASYDEQSEPYAFQVTAYGAFTFRCQLASAFIGAGIHEIQCRDATGVLFDSRFVLSYNAEASIIGRTDLRYGEYNEASAGVSLTSTGVYTVPAEGMAAARGQMVVSARGTGTAYCHTGGWGPSGTAMAMTVRCFGPGGTPTNSAFTLGVTW